MEKGGAETCIWIFPMRFTLNLDKKSQKAALHEHTMLHTLCIQGSHEERGFGQGHGAVLH